MLGETQTLQRANMVALLRRKSGLSPFPVVTRADAEYATNWHHRLHELQEVDLGSVQNDNGTWPYMPGWDGPQE